MSAPHGQGPPVSTAADLLALVVAHYAATASRGAWAPGTTYAAGDTVGSGGKLYLCFAGGSSDNGSGPTGVGSQRDSNGVGWTPVVYVGERYRKQTGAPPRVLFLIGNGEITDRAPTGTPARVGAGYLAQDVEEIRAYIWAAETTDDIARYAAIEAMKDQLVNMVRKVAPGRAAIRTVNATVESNVVTFGEDRQVVITYTRGVPRDGAIWSVAITPQPTLDPMRPNGDLGTTYIVDPITNASR